MKTRKKVMMRAKDCFLRDLNEGDTFTIKNSATRYTLHAKSEPNYTVYDERGDASYAAPFTPVKPLKQF